MKIAIAGAGKLGLQVAEALLKGDHSVTIIDNNDQVLNKVSGKIDVLTVDANAKQISVLQDINIENYDYLLTATDTDENNIFIATCAKLLGCPRVIARVRDPEHVNQFDFIKDKFAIDYIVNPDMAVTREIHKYLVEKYTLENGVFSSGRVAILEFKVSRMRNFIGQEIGIVREILPGMQVVAVSRNGKILVSAMGLTIQE
ncbi:MAG: NAD-binding protein, partial [Anaerovoracaceae bacterium]